MRSKRMFTAVDSPTEGMPTRVITGGVGVIPGATMNDKRLYFMEYVDDIRLLLMNEPRGHAAMSGAILQLSTRPDAEWGVVYIEVSGCLPMCGHGTIGVATGMVEVVEPVTEIRLDTPTGLVIARVAVSDGHDDSITIENVPHPVCGSTTRSRFPVTGPSHTASPSAETSTPWSTSMRSACRSIDGTSRISTRPASRSWRPSTPRTRRGIRSSTASTTATTSSLIAPWSTAEHSRHAMAIYPCWFDRSPCGTGTSARMAELWARGELALDTDFVNESFIGSRFTGRLIRETTVDGIPAVVPTITGRAWVTGIGQYLLDPSDPFPAGFQF
jgi:proline racemase